jgi:spermidine/putrescine-binding protein
MLKIKKGIKKKIKGKKDKGKEEDDLFDPEQLEKLKKELAEKRKAAAAENGEDPSEVASSSLAPHEQDEDWLKFQALTAGVDSILKKTTEELGKIKETSFYQRKSTDPTNLWKSDADKVAEAEAAEAEARWVELKEAQEAEEPEVLEVSKLQLNDFLRLSFI